MILSDQTSTRRLLGAALSLLASGAFVVPVFGQSEKDSKAVVAAQTAQAARPHRVRSEGGTLVFVPPDRYHLTLSDCCPRELILIGAQVWAKSEGGWTRKDRQPLDALHAARGPIPLGQWGASPRGVRANGGQEAAGQKARRYEYVTGPTAALASVDMLVSEATGLPIVYERQGRLRTRWEVDYPPGLAVEVPGQSIASSGLPLVPPNDPPIWLPELEIATVNLPPLPAVVVRGATDYQVGAARVRSPKALTTALKPLLGQPAELVMFVTKDLLWESLDPLLDAAQAAGATALHLAVQSPKEPAVGFLKVRLTPGETGSDVVVASAFDATIGDGQAYRVRRQDVGAPDLDSTFRALLAKRGNKTVFVEIIRPSYEFGFQLPLIAAIRRAGGEVVLLTTGMQDLVGSAPPPPPPPPRPEF